MPKSVKPPRGRGRPLETVSVPPPLEPLFLKAQDYVRRYFSDRVEEPARSTISISGERYILVRAASMSVEFFDLVVSLYREKGVENARAVANNILFDLAHAIGKADARSFHKKMKVDDPVEKLSAGPVHFAFAGWAFVDIFPESKPSPDENYYLVYDHPFSFESDAWVTRGRKSDAPVCIMNAGYSSGWCEESFGLPLVAAEIECVASGGQHCRFIMAPPSRIEEHLARYVGTGDTAAAGAAASSRAGDRTRVTVPEFFQRKRLEDEVKKSQQDLEKRVEERTAELLSTNELLRSEIKERKRTEQQLRLLGSAVQNADEGIVIMSPAFDAIGPRILFVNQGFSRMTGLSSDEVVGETLRLLGADPSDRLVAESLHQHLAQGKAFRGEMAALRRDGSPYALELHVMPVQDMVAGVTHWIGILRDVSERRVQLAALERQALYDALTDLPNRVLFRDRVGHAIAQARRDRQAFAVLLM
ncbi:MAG TPA: PAS domain S-box protein, partial [Thermoanaerobaculia bacterium]|nr:PAS domain S-box protein [Thermoanaerobaculia bacterium]